MFKLTSLQPTSGRVTITVEGDLRHDAAIQLESLCAAEPVGALNIAGLRSADAAGRDTLLRLRRAGWRLEGASLYVHSLLQETDA